MSPAKTDTILWNNAMAKHLLNRTGFDGRPEEIANFERCGLQASVNSLFNFTPVSPCGTGLVGQWIPKPSSEESFTKSRCCSRRPLLTSNAPVVASAKFFGFCQFTR